MPAFIVPSKLTVNPLAAVIEVAVNFDMLVVVIAFAVSVAPTAEKVNAPIVPVVTVPPEIAAPLATTAPLVLVFVRVNVPALSVTPPV